MKMRLILALHYEVLYIFVFSSTELDPSSLTERERDHRKREEEVTHVVLEDRDEKNLDRSRFDRCRFRY